MNTYTLLLHSHKLFVSLFVLLYLIKTILFFANRTKSDAFRQNIVARISEMVISFAFLATGIALLVYTAEIRTILMIKIAIVLASIPLAIIGYKKSKAILVIVSFLCLLAAYGIGEASKKRKKVAIATEVDTSNPQVYGKAIFAANCVVCHGEDGTLGASGAANLQASQLDLAGRKGRIQNGKGSMQAYKKIFNEAEIDALAEYVQSLKK